MGTGDHVIELSGVAIRSHKNEIETRAIQQRGQYVSSRSRTQIRDYLVLAGFGRDWNLCASLAVYLRQDFRERGFVRPDGQPSILKSYMESWRWLAGQRA